jgi:hypothetical protein
MTTGPTRRYRPGGNKRYSAGRISDDCVAFIRVYWGSIKLYVKPKTNEPKDRPTEPGPNVVLLLTPDQKPSISMELSALTQRELVELGKFLEFTGGLVQSLIRHRDEVAARAYAEGDDSFVRSYRPVPQLVVRDGALAQYSESLLIGPEGIPGELGRGLAARGLRGVRDDLAGEAPTGAVSEDNGPPPDEPEGVREVGGVG